jgi:DNA-binding beta-propeller fold protein YncE
MYTWGIKHPSRVAINKEGTTLYVTASKTDAAVFKLPVSQDFSGTDGPVEVIAGNTNGPQDRGYVGDGTTLAGTATSVKLGGPRGIAVTPTGTVLVTDAYNHRVLQIQDTKGTDAQRSRRPSRTVRYV